MWGRTDGRQWFRICFAGIAYPTVVVGSAQCGTASALLQNGHRIVGRAHRRLWHVLAGTAVTIFGHRTFVVRGRVAALARGRGDGRGAVRGARCGSRGGMALVAVTKVRDRALVGGGRREALAICCQCNLTAVDTRCHGFWNVVACAVVAILVWMAFRHRRRCSRKAQGKATTHLSIVASNRLYNIKK